MINLFIAAAVAFLFWGKMTKDEEEKIENASWIRTTVYLVLTILVGVFYYKTYQVATIKNFVMVNELHGSHDKNSGENIDTIQYLCIMNRFTDSNFFSTMRQFSSEKIDSTFRERENKGGLLLYHILKYDTLSTVIPNKQGNNGIDNFNQIYEIAYFANKIPSISLLQRKTKHEKDSIGGPEKHFFSECQQWDLLDVPDSIKDDLINYIGPFGVMSIFREWTFGLDSLGPFEKCIEHTSNGRLINRLDFFTAADISQCSYAVGIDSDCPLEYVNMTFDIPVEISPLGIEPDVLTANGFEYKDSVKLKELQHKILYMHIKFPTLANMQLIRSLILTTLISALLTLFISNLFFLICSIIRSVKRKKNWEYYPSRLELKMKILRYLAVIICVILSIVSILLIFDKYLWFESDSRKVFRIVFWNVVFVVVFGLLWINDWSKKKKEDKESEDNTNNESKQFDND